MRSSWRIGAVVATVGLLAGGLGACGAGGSGDGGATRQVLVDFSSDEFASFALFNFPAQVKVRQGDTVEFKQTWTGEPHTVTGGAIVDETLADGAAWVDFFGGFQELLSSGAELPDPENPGDATIGDFWTAVEEAEDREAAELVRESYAELAALDIGLPAIDASSTQPWAELVEVIDVESGKFFDQLPSAFTDDELAQNVSQPCYRDEGGPPEDPEEACAKADQRQPAFTGRQSYYNSGVIPYEGERSNTFEVEIADDAELGTFLFYCAIHGLGQKSEIEIVAAGEDIPDQSAVNRQIREETKAMTDGLTKIYEDAEDGEATFPGFDEPVEGPFAGLPGVEHTAINEFLPRTMTVKANEPITWKMMGSDHTISFNVPKYFPIMEFLDDGTVRINPKLQPAAGGATPYEEPEERTGEGPPAVDGGTFDGTGFWSSGLIGAQPYLEYTMRISKPGTYSYACLLHPPMIGQVKVT